VDGHGNRDVSEETGTMKLPKSIAVAALFGSQVRGDVDSLSDSDILLIGADEDREEAVHSLRSQGYSPSFYTWSQFCALADDGSLFVQHVKQEGLVVRDSDVFSEVLRIFVPAKSVARKLQDNLALVELTDGTPRLPTTVAWALDVLAVAVRNYAILKNAEVGYYVFGYADLVHQLGHKHGLDCESQRALLELRLDKHHYRQAAQLRDDIASAWERLSLARRAISVIAEARVSDLAPADADAFIERGLRPMPGAHWYIPLRRVEGAYCAVRDSVRVDDSTLCSRIEALISSPSPYGLPHQNSAANLSVLVKSLRDAHCYGGATAMQTAAID
jgi:hypothetical protein